MQVAEQKYSNTIEMVWWRPWNWTAQMKMYKCKLWHFNQLMIKTNPRTNEFHYQITDHTIFDIVQLS